MVVTEIKRDDQVSEVLLGSLGAQVNLRGYDGVKKDPVLNTVLSTGNYGLIEQTTHGKHIAVPLSATAVGAAPDTTNSVLLVLDNGVFIGAGKPLFLYDAAGIDVVQLSNDGDGGLVLGGSGANAGRLSLSGDLVVSGNLLWKSGTANTMTFDHAITADRTVTFQDLAGTVALLGAQNAGSLLFVDNTHDIGASGATRPRDLFLARNATIGGTLSAAGTTVTTLHATGAATLDTTLAVTGALTGASTVQGTRLISTVATGTAPLSVTSTTNVPNLNAEYLNDKHDTAFAQLASASNFTTAPTINSAMIARIATGSYTGNGSSTQTISGLPFGPAIVLVTMSDTSFGALAQITAGGTMVAHVNGATSTNISDPTVGISGTSFVAGLAAGTNFNTRTYRYVALG